ncbi:MAG: M1 family aminopeptidase [Nitrospiraceae bacterium]|nr:M1 family aminopeptidase [Nitrospiraceae bacterium]
MFARRVAIGIIVSCFMFAPSIYAEGREDAPLPEYNLNVSFDIASSRIYGTVKIVARAGTELTLHRGESKIVQAAADGNAVDLAGDEPKKIVMKADGAVQIDYEADFRQSEDNIIDERGIALRGTWYPLLEGMCIYRLKATLPAGYVAISEAERVMKDTRDTAVEYRFEFPYPLNEDDGISLIASRNFVVTQDSYNGIEIVAYLFPEEAGFARIYIEHAKRYLKTYEALLGRYPYKMLSLVEHFEPAGYSLPTYILLGREDFKLPIEKTPLGHEIVHQWFGNYVYTDYEKGNWNEGFTIYFADHAYDEQQGKGWKCRRRILSGYKSHVKDAIEFPLKEFSERYDPASRSIGYGKAAMVVHMLRRTIGDEAFYASMRDFISENKFRVTSWDDIKRSFEKKTGKDMARFFGQWIGTKGTPHLSIDDVSVAVSQTKFSVSFDLVQEKTDFTLPVPVTFYSKGKKITRIFTLDKSRERISVVLSEMPDEIVLDEDYDLFRTLMPEEDPPTLERLAADEKRLIVLPPERKGMYREIIDAFNEKGAGIKLAYLKSGNPLRKDHSGDGQKRHHRSVMKSGTREKRFYFKELTEISDEAVKNSSLAVLGKDNPVIERLFGKKEFRKDDGGPLRVDIRKNPFNPEKVVAIIHVAGKKYERQKVSPSLDEIFEYPFYSRYSVQDGRVTKELQEAPRGIRIKVGL